MTDLGYRSASDLVAAIKAKEVGSRELLDHLLDRVDKHNPALNAVITLDADRARAQADAADEATARGDDLGPLHGLPMTIKDVFETEGLRSTSGAPELMDHVPDHDAGAVARLKDAGAIVFGKTNLPLYAGDIQTFNQPFGVTNNPWDTDRTPGGSSGGAAAALAAGLTPLELGSDIGGSIRNPSHLCGTVGLKPSLRRRPPGRLPVRPDRRCAGSTSTSCGPMARTVDDLSLAFDVLAGPGGARARPGRRDCGWPRGSRPRACPSTRRWPTCSPPPSTASGRTGSTWTTTARPDVDFDEATDLYVQLLYTVMTAATGVDDDTWALATVDRGHAGGRGRAHPRPRRPGHRHASPRLAPARRAPARRSGTAGPTSSPTSTSSCARSSPLPAFPHQVDDDPTGVVNRLA